MRLGLRDSRKYGAGILEKFNQILHSPPSRIGTMQEKSRMKAPMGAGGTPKRFRGSNLLVDGARRNILNVARASRKISHES